MTKQKTGRNAASGKFVGVSTTADVKASRQANAHFASNVMSSKKTAEIYVRALEGKIGIKKK